MKRSLATLAGLLGLLCAPVDALAQFADSALDRFDFEAARNSFFAQADRNADLALSHAELADALGFSAPPIFDGQDYDGDGAITYSEYLESGDAIFTDLDTNGDGVLSMEEF